MNDEKLKRWVTLGIAAAIAAAFLWFFGKYLLSCLLPFIIAYMISLAVRPAAAFISRRAGVGKRFVSAFIVLVLIFAIVLLLSYVSTVLVKEAASAAQAASEWLLRDDNALRRAIDSVADAASNIPIFEGLSEESIYGALSSVINSALTTVAACATSLVGKLPGFIFAVITTVGATFYLCTDKGQLAREAEALFGKDATRRLARVRAKLGGAVSSYFKGYFILMLVTLGELLLSFTILGIDGALFLSFVIALVDLLPVVGSGTVLIPWALVELFITGDTRLGVGLLVTVGVMFVVRRIAEPRVIGSTMGIHPLISLLAVYAGLVLFGIPGAIFFPVLVYFIKAYTAQKIPAD